MIKKFILLILSSLLTFSCSPGLGTDNGDDFYEEEEDEENYITCVACKGSGLCHACGGDGLWLGDWEECDYCDGSGICDHCDGTGVIEF